MPDESRADYFKERRKSKKHFNVLIDRKKAEAIEEKLRKDNKTKTAWVEEKIDEDLKQ